MAGAVVTDLDLCEAPNDNNICGPTTDLAGVYVENNPEDCDIFETCEAGNPICSALPAGSCPFEVVDEAICQLDVPEQVQLFECEAGSNLGDGALVTDPQLCNAATPAEQCAEGTTLEGIWVHPDETATCNLVLPQTCPAGTALEGVSVSNIQFCDLNGLEVCPDNTDQAGHFVKGDGNLATTNDLSEVCDLPDTEVEICASTTDLAGMVVSNTDGELNGLEAACEISIDDVELQTCPANTALAGVAISDEQFAIDEDTDGIPDICVIQDLDKCPAGSDLAGLFVMDTDGNTVFDDILPDVAEAICDQPDAQICDSNTDLAGVVVENAPEDCEIDLADVELNLCPANTALAGVAISDEQFAIDEDTDGIPDICTIQGLEKCPAGTDKAGFFVMGDGDLTTTDELTALCDDTTEVCPANTALAGVVVQDPADDNPATVPAICSLNGLEICPAGTDLEGVFAMGDGDLATTVPDPLTPTCLDCIENALTPEELETFIDYLEVTPPGDPVGTVEEYCALDAFQDATTVGQVRGLLAGDFNAGASGIVLSDAELDELAQCVFNALNADTILEENCDLLDSNVEVCPDDTALAGVAVQDDGDPLTIPDICTLNGLEKCPVGTDLEGVFAMGDGDTTTTAPADTTLATNCEKWDICPAGTALAGVTVEPGLPDTTPMNGIPDICTVQGLEKCPAGTPQEGHFVMGDGNTATNQVTNPGDIATYDATLAAICSANNDQAETCAIGTELQGILVDDTDDVNDGMEAACNPLEICPVGTALEGVAVLDDSDPDTPLPESLCTLNGLEKCPVGTDQAGHFVMGDGDPTTIREILPICDSLDLAIANNNADNVHIRLGTGTGSFGPLIAFTVGDGPQSVALADLNVDGFLDFVTANFNGDNFSVRLGDGTGSFGAVTTTGLGDGGPRFVAVGDFNDDAIPDLAIAMYDNDDIEIRLGTGTGTTFTAAADVPVGDLPRSIALGFFNNDDNLDMAIANEGNDDVSIRLGDGDGTFDGVVVADVPVGNQPFSVAVGFFNNDAIADLAIANFADDDVSIRLGDGDGTFDGVVVADVPVGDQPESVAVGHFNPVTDTFQDIVTANFNANNVSVRLGTGTGTFTGTTNFAVGDDPIFVAVADFNRDGYDDLAVANNNDDDFSILLNSGANTYARTDFPAASEPWSIAVGFIN
jgi:hypothetical protein